MTTTAKYDPHADRWSEQEYADAETYLAHRAQLVVALGPRLEPGDRVVDLACGDAGLAPFLEAFGLGYLGVDASAPMVAAARRRGVDARQADLNDFRPDQPVAATTCFRAIYYADDRRGFFRLLGEYTERKLVFDLSPRRYRVDEVRADLRAAGFERLDLQPFFSPQHARLPAPAAAILRGLERTGPLARLLLRLRFSYVCAASRRN